MMDRKVRQPRRRTWRIFFLSVTKNTAVLFLFFGGCFALSYLSLSGVEKPSDEALEDHRFGGVLVLTIFLASFAAFFGWLACVFVEAWRSVGKPLRSRPALLPHEPDRSGVTDAVRRRSVRLRARGPQIARAHNWREYFWRVTQKAALVFLIGTAVLVPAVLSTVPESPGWLLFVVGLAWFVFFGGFVVALPSSLLWLWCVLIDAVGSAAEAARTRRTNPPRRPLTLKDVDNEGEVESLPRAADHAEQQDQFRPGLPHRRSEGIQE
jgi:hypothetical protein